MKFKRTTTPPPLIIFLTEHLSQIKLSCTKIDLTKCQNQYADNFASSVYLYSALIKSSFFFFDFLLSIDRFFFFLYIEIYITWFEGETGFISLT